MAHERFEDKQLAKKDDAKIKGEAVEEKLNPHEQAKNAVKTEGRCEGENRCESQAETGRREGQGSGKKEDCRQGEGSCESKSHH